MLTTNISQIVSSIITVVPFKRKDQRLRIFKYILGIFLPKHINESQIASEIMSSQSTMSRALSRSPVNEISKALSKEYTVTRKNKDEYKSCR